MKRGVILILVLFSFLSSIAQIPELWGITSDKYYSNWGYGRIFKIKANGAGYTIVHSFNYSDGYLPISPLLLANNGLIYGTTSSGGLVQGVLYSLDPLNGNFTKLHDFGVAQNDGLALASPVTQASNGKLYGMTGYGGIYGHGTIYSYDIQSGSYQKIHDFNDTLGSQPSGPLLQANNGLLYGTTLKGNIFSIDPITDVFTNLNFLTGLGGMHPNGGVIQGYDGKLYGLTRLSSTGLGCNCGSIIRYDITNNSFTTIYNLSWLEETPVGCPLQGKDSLLYIGSEQGRYSCRDGSVFTYNILTGVADSIHGFDTTTGYYPRASLMQASDGLMYGTTYMGDRQGHTAGVLYSLDPVTLNYSIIHTFDTLSGSYPISEMIEMNSTYSGISEAKWNSENIYPNPSNDVIELPNANMIDRLNVKDIYGNEKIDVLHPGNKLIVSDLESGVYFLTIFRKGSVSVSEIMIFR